MARRSGNAQKAASGGLLRLALFAALSALVAFMLVGCGEGDRVSKDSYEKKVQTAFADVRGAFRGIIRKNERARPRVLGARIDRAASVLDREAHKLENGEPPKDVEEANEELVEGLRGYAGDVHELARRVSKGNVAAIASFNATIADNESIKRMSEAAEEMIKHGYDVGFEPD